MNNGDKKQAQNCTTRIGREGIARKEIPRRRREDNIEMYFTEIGCEDLGNLELRQDRFKRWAFMITSRSLETRNLLIT
jgi:hypothetical protein